MNSLREIILEENDCQATFPKAKYSVIYWTEEDNLSLSDLDYLLHNMKILDDPTCRVYMEDDEISIHVICTYRNLQGATYRIFRSETLDLSTLGDKMWALFMTNGLDKIIQL